MYGHTWGNYDDHNTCGWGLYELLMFVITQCGSSLTMDHVSTRMRVVLRFNALMCWCAAEHHSAVVTMHGSVVVACRQWSVDACWHWVVCRADEPRNNEREPWRSLTQRLQAFRASASVGRSLNFQIFLKIPRSVGRSVNQFVDSKVWNRESVI